MSSERQLGEAMRRFGLGLPGAHEDHPWGELVLKAKGKVFVFLGKPSDELCFSVKLPKSGVRLLDNDWCEPTAYGLGKSGWVTVRWAAGNALGAEELCALVEESYRAVAQKTLVKELDGRGAGGGQAPKPRAATAARRAKPATKKKTKKKAARKA